MLDDHRAEGPPGFFHYSYITHNLDRMTHEIPILMCCHKFHLH